MLIQRKLFHRIVHLNYVQVFIIVLAIFVNSSVSQLFEEEYNGGGGGGGGGGDDEALSMEQKEEMFPGRQEDWFRVRREPQDSIPNGEALSQKVNFNDDHQHDQEFDESASGTKYSEDGNSDAQMSSYQETQPSEGSTRSRRLYTPPSYGLRRGDDTHYGPSSRYGGDGCKCDMEYVLKYRGVSPGGGGTGRLGEYQVKVFHEETGRYTGNPMEDTRGWSQYEQGLKPKPVRNKYEYYTDVPSRSFQQQPQQQQQRPKFQQYYVEESERPVDRGRDMFVRGDGRLQGGSDGRGGDSGISRTQKSRIVRHKFPTIPMRKFKRSKVAKLARFVVSNSDWAMASVISSGKSQFGGYPFVQRVKVSDGIQGNSSGVPYIYMTPGVLDACDYGDLEISKASLTLSLNPPGEEDACSNEDSRKWACASVTMSGRIIPITSTSELEQAENAISNRHTFLDKDGFLARLIITQVVVYTNSVSDQAQTLEVSEYLA